MSSFKQITCKTALSPSLLPGLDYTLNPYLGCEHACIYCYAPHTLHYSGEEQWGTFVSAKMNIPAVLEREARKKKPGVVGISTVTDPYQPLEAKLQLTRRCLEVLLAKDFPICIQTKSALVTRDIDLITMFGVKEVGFTVTTLDDQVKAIMEPGASLPGKRLKALKELSDAGIPVWAFVGPMIPGVIDEEILTSILYAIKGSGVERVMFDRLRLKPGMWSRMEPYLREHDKLMLEACRSALFKNDGTFEAYKANAKRICEELKLECQFSY